MKENISNVRMYLRSCRRSSVLLNPVNSIPVKVNINNGRVILHRFFPLRWCHNSELVTMGYLPMYPDTCYIHLATFLLG